MPLPTPNLDDRRFQDIVDDARRAIPRYCPEWTDHNIHDPGITLIELFAHMVETMLFRLNRVPEKSYITFMELMGVRLKEAAAARTDLTFWLTAPAAEPIPIPAGTEVATTQTAVAEAVTFSTDRDMLIVPPELRHVMTSPDERSFADYSDTLEIAATPFPAFADPPAPGNAFYLGFANDLSGHLLAADFDIREVTGTGIDPTDPPLSWEAYCKLRGDTFAWVAAEVEYDQTAGLNQAGQVAVHLPQRMHRYALKGVEAYWVRCRFRQTRGAQEVYQTSPRIYAVASASYGATISATHAFALSEEVVGRSDGLPGQSFKLQFTPVLPRKPATERVEVQAEDGSWEPWVEVEHFADSGPGDPHVTIDSVQGIISFGPTIRDPQGGERQYGRVPRLGALVRMGRYRCGGGASGNLAPGKLNVLKTGVPFVGRVKNRVAAVGGRDAETIEYAALRAPRLLRTSFRAVTAEDYEYLAQEASQSVARVCCRQPRAGAPGSTQPGVVRVLVVPTVSSPARRVAPEELVPPATLIDDVESFLNERRLLTTTLKVEGAPVSEVRVEARVKARPRFDPERVRADVHNALNRFLNPIVGGQEGKGWPFGRELYISEVFALIQGVPGVEFIEAARMLVIGQEAPVSKVSLGPDGIITSGEHVIAVTP